MEVKPGYKQTEVGVIPEEWESSKVGDFAFVTKLAGFEYTLHFDYLQSGPVIAIRALNIKNGTLDLEEVHTIPKITSDKLPRSKLVKGDLVISYVGTLGRVAVIPEDDKFHLAPNVAKISVEKKHVAPEFLGQYLNSFRGQKLILQAAASTTQAALSMANLREIFFARPPIPEQRAIAGALSDVDALIRALDQLIAKKRDLKQAVMQQLLTSQKRLPGFHGEWELQQLADVIDFVNGKPHEGHIDQMGRYYLITLDSIGINGKLKSEHRRVGLWDNSLAKDDVAIILSDIAHGNLLGLCDVIPEDNRYVLNQRVGRLRVKPEAKANPQFLRLQINRHQDHFKNRGQGTSQRHIYRRDIDQLEIELPEPIEQAAIAEVLSDMDAELAALEQRRDKTRALKQGMMQELLTGRTRLVDSPRSYD